VPIEDDRRRYDDDEDDDRPRRRDDDEDDDRPARPPQKQKSGVGRVLLVLLGLGCVGLLLCCGGIGACLYFAPKQIDILDATRTKSPEGGTASVTVNLRVGSSGPGPFVRGEYVLNVKAGNRTSVHRMGLRGDAGGEFKTTLLTPELVKEPGPVEFWVERDDRGSVTRVSEVRTIP
jgi:hypothetical protein